MAAAESPPSSDIASVPESAERPSLGCGTGGFSLSETFPGVVSAGSPASTLSGVC